MSTVYLGLSGNEARELIYALQELQAESEGFHKHVSNATYAPRSLSSQ